MSEFTTVLVVVILAVLSPIIAGRIRVPGVVTEVILGMLLGLLVFLVDRWRGITLLATEPGGAFDFLAEVGFIMLLFMVGLEVDFDRIEEQGLRPFLLGAVIYGLTFGLAYLFVWYWGLHFIVTLILATTAVDVVLPTMREVGIHKTPMGHAIMLSATIADFTTITVLTIYIFGQGFGGGGFHAGYLLLPGLLAIFWLAYRFGGELVWRFPRTLSRFFKSEDPTELGVRASLALMFVFVGLSSAFGVEAIFGAFFAGVLISALFREGALLEEKLYGVGYGFFVPIFFLSVGLSFDFNSVADVTQLVILPILLGVAIGVKLIPAMVFLPRYGFRRTTAVGFLLSARLSFMIAVSSVAFALDFIDATLYATTILLAIVLSTLGPILFRAIMGRKHLDAARDEAGMGVGA